MTPLSGHEPRTRQTPAMRTPSGNSSFDLQHRENNLRHDREALADERQQLAQERRQLERDRQAFDEQVEERDQQRDQQIVERHAAARAEVLAGDLAHDIDDNRPGYVASQIIAAAAKARGQLAEAPTGLALSIIKAGQVRRGEAGTDDPPLPENAKARAIILSGRRRRGEAISESDEAFLSSYLEKADGRYRR